MVLVGVPGVGKTRLTSELGEDVVFLQDPRLANVERYLRRVTGTRTAVDTLACVAALSVVSSEITHGSHRWSDSHRISSTRCRGTTVISVCACAGMPPFVVGRLPRSRNGPQSRVS